MTWQQPTKHEKCCKHLPPCTRLLAGTVHSELQHLAVASYTACLYTCTTFCAVAGYDQEARYFEAGVRQAKRQELQSKLEVMVKQLFEQQLMQLKSKLLQAFKNDVSGCIADKIESFADATHRYYVILYTLRKTF